MSFYLQDVANYADDKTFDEVINRIDKTIDFLMDRDEFSVAQLFNAITEDMEIPEFSQEAIDILNDTLAKFSTPESFENVNREERCIIGVILSLNEIRRKDQEPIGMVYNYTDYMAFIKDELILNRKKYYDYAEEVE